MKGIGIPQGWQTSANLSPKTKINPGSREVSTVYYPPDGSGRDTYVIKGHGGSCKEYRKGFVDYQGEYLRNNNKHPYETPVMNSKLVNPSMTTYNNWQTKGRRMQNKKIFEEQKSSVERLSHSPRLDLYDSENTLQKQLSS